MRDPRLFLMLFPLFLLSGGFGDALRGDDVILSNGSVIRGKATKLPSEEAVRIEIEGVGFLTLPAQLVLRIDESTDGGTAARATAREGEDDVRPANAGPRKIRTTHRVVLDNESVLHGNLLPTKPGEPAQIEIPTLGTMTISRDRIAKIESAEGEIVITPPPPPRKTEEPAPGARATEKPTEKPTEVPDFSTIVDEISTRVIDRYYDERYPPLPSTSRIERIEYYVGELTKHRSTKRVRAENYLRSYGRSTIPFLGPAARHPFDLTRRAVQRLVRDVGALEGVPLAIRALNDPDLTVRYLAQEALDEILEESISYRPSWPERARRNAQDAYWKLWLDLERARLRDDLASELLDVLEE